MQSVISVEIMVSTECVATEKLKPEEVYQREGGAYNNCNSDVLTRHVGIKENKKKCFKH